MTYFGDDHVRRALWLELLEMVDRLQYLADEWLRHDREVSDLEELVALANEQDELPFDTNKTEGSEPS